jgi:hypothetical protein
MGESVRRQEEEQQQRQENIRKAIMAAGGKCMETLRGMVTDNNWTAVELDDVATSGSYKGAIHMAAWRGSLANVEYLLDLGCDINLISLRQYSYGKTPLHFALTQNRDDIVQLLLKRGANCKIVNNYGQSALSLASPSRVSSETRALIQQAETDNNGIVPDWINYRATHSDGLEYGDLDPRFLDRPVRPTDVVEEFVVNPTTKETRKGGFARLNEQKKSRKDSSTAAASLRSKRKDRKCRHVPLTVEEKEKREECWETIQQVLANANHNSTGEDDDGGDLVSQSYPTAITGVGRNVDAVVQPLATIVQIRDRQKMRWIQEEAERLEQTLQEADSDSDYFCSDGSHIPDAWVRCLQEREDVTPRQVSLVRRLLAMALNKSQKNALDEDGDDDEDADTSHDTTSGAASNVRRTVPQELLLRAQNAVTGLPKELLQRSVSSLVNESTSEHLLALPRTPLWVDTVGDVRKLYNVLVEREKQEQFVIGVDTEWHDDENGSPRVATLQVAIPSERSTDKSIDAWVLDMMPTSQEESEYHSEMIQLVLWIFQQSESVVLGFSFGHDIPKINAYLHRHHTNRQYTPISMEKIVDMQIVAAYYATQRTRPTKSTMPGLKSTCSRYLAISADDGDCNVTYALEKKEQCSDWSQRPLRSSQLEYAGLDAGVLLVLLNTMPSDLVPV